MPKIWSAMKEVWEGRGEFFGGNEIARRILVKRFEIFFWGHEISESNLVQRFEIFGGHKIALSDLVQMYEIFGGHKIALSDLVQMYKIFGGHKISLNDLVKMYEIFGGHKISLSDLVKMYEILVLDYHSRRTGMDKSLSCVRQSWLPVELLQELLSSCYSHNHVSQVELTRLRYDRILSDKAVW